MENDDIVMNDVETNLDLNLDPSNSEMGLGPLLSDRIEDRIRRLEEVTARARQRQRWRQARNPPPESSNNNALEPRSYLGIESSVHSWDENVGAVERTVERGKSCKRDSSHLVARALEMDVDIKKDVADGGRFYDCNICLDMAKEPILTCCGHLFCWACFYKLSYVNATAKECPVCKGEVTDANITPIYGGTSDTPECESDLKIPPRPPAHRVESARQQRVNGRISHIPVAEALRRIRIGIGAATEQPRQEEVAPATAENTVRPNVEGAIAASETSSRVMPSAEAMGSRRLRSRQFSRVLSESAASLSSISSALNNAERLVEDLETYINGRLLRRMNPRFVQTDNGGDPSSNSIPSMQTELQTVGSTTDTNLEATHPLSSERPTASAAVFPAESSDTGAVSEGDLSVPRPRRRSGISRVSDVESGVSREPRRRRLR